MAPAGCRVQRASLWLLSWSGLEPLEPLQLGRPRPFRRHAPGDACPCFHGGLSGRGATPVRLYLVWRTEVGHVFPLRFELTRNSSHHAMPFRASRAGRGSSGATRRLQVGPVWALPGPALPCRSAWRTGAGGPALPCPSLVTVQAPSRGVARRERDATATSRSGGQARWNASHKAVDQRGSRLPRGRYSTRLRPARARPSLRGGGFVAGRQVALRVCFRCASSAASAGKGRAGKTAGRRQLFDWAAGVAFISAASAFCFKGGCRLIGNCYYS